MATPPRLGARAWAQRDEHWETNSGSRDQSAARTLQGDVLARCKETRVGERLRRFANGRQSAVQPAPIARAVSCRGCRFVHGRNTQRKATIDRGSVCRLRGRLVTGS
eukprot:13952-Pleurochrysis_carterae.AAC.2